MMPPQSASGASPSRGRPQWPGKAGSTGAHTWDPVALVQAWFRQWWQARLPLQDTVTLTQHQAITPIQHQAVTLNLFQGLTSPTSKTKTLKQVQGDG